MPFEPLSYREASIATWKNAAINAAADVTVTIAAGKRFQVYHVFVEAEGAIDITFKSGATAISGPIAFAANDEKEWKNDGFPVFIGVAAGDDFVLDQSGTTQINGFIVYSEVEHTA